MKKTDIASLILIAAGSVLIAYFVAEALVGQPSSEPVSVRTMEPISAEVEKPDSEVFNDKAINPTVEVIIGENDS